MFNPLQTRARLWKAAVVLLTGATLAGCSGHSVPQFAGAPDPTNALGSDEGHWVGVNSHSTASLAGNGNGTSQTFYLSTARGGTFTYGRYTLTFPAWAVSGDAWITITEPNPTLVGCDLSIYPAFLNHFNVPVTLTMDCTNTNVTPQNISTLEIFWHAQGGWLAVGDDDNPARLTISAPLQHFSSYRAGW